MCAILELLSQRNRCSRSSKRYPQCYQLLQSLILHHSCRVRHAIKELCCQQGDARMWQRENLSMLVSLLEQTYRQLPLDLQYRGGMSFPKGIVDLEGKMCDANLCTVKLALPSLDATCQGDGFLERLDGHFKDIDRGHEFDAHDIQEQHKMYNELKLVVKLQGESNIIKLLAFQMKPMPFYYVLERSELGTLEHVLVEERRAHRPVMTINTLLDISIQALEAIQLCNNRSILVRLINTASFMVFGGKEHYRIKLANLQLARDITTFAEMETHREICGGNINAL